MKGEAKLAKEKKSDEYPDEKGELKVEMELLYSPKHTKNHLHMGFGDTAVTIYEDKTKEKELGRIMGAMGGCLDITDRETGETWTIRPEAFWAAYQEFKKRRGA